jgi:hypothetical protein
MIDEGLGPIPGSQSPCYPDVGGIGIEDDRPISHVCKPPGQEDRNRALARTALPEKPQAHAG